MSRFTGHCVFGSWVHPNCEDFPCSAVLCRTRINICPRVSSAVFHLDLLSMLRAFPAKRLIGRACRAVPWRTVKPTLAQRCMQAAHITAPPCHMALMRVFLKNIISIVVPLSPTASALCSRRCENWCCLPVGTSQTFKQKGRCFRKRY